MTEWWKKKEIPEKEARDSLENFTKDMVEKGVELGRMATAEDMDMDEEQFNFMKANMFHSSTDYETYLKAKGMDSDWHVKVIKDMLDGKERKEEEIKEWHDTLKKYNSKCTAMDKVDIIAFHRWAARNLNFDKYIKKYGDLEERENKDFARDTVLNSMFFEYIRRGYVPKVIEGMKETTFFDEKSMKLKGHVV